MAGYNKVILMGNLIESPELRYTPSGTAVADVRLAVNTTMGSGDKKKEEVLFIDCVAWAKTAEIICQYHSKGDQILVEGRLTLDQWEDRESGAKRQKIKMVIDRFTFAQKLSERGEGGQQKPAQDESFDSGGDASY